MTTLALVDLDNLFGHLDDQERAPALWVPRRQPPGSAFLWVEDDGLDATSETAGDRTRCVVAFAANTRTLVRNSPDTAYLGRLSRRLARVLGHVDPSAVTWELAMTLAVPQAADRALVQMLVRAASSDNALTFDAVSVISADRGLIALVRARLGGAWATPPRVMTRPLVTMFVRPRGLKRRYAEPATSSGAPTMPTAGANVIRIETPEASAWATTQIVQREATLADTASAVERHPSILTQISITRTSFRGVARLPDVPGTALGSCSPDDGVELAVVRTTETRARGGRGRSSSIGPGAVQLEPLRATVHTALPTAWLAGREIGEGVLLGPAVNRLDDADLLARESPLLPRGWMLHVAMAARVASRYQPAALEADVQPDAAAEVQGWWTTHGARRPKSRVCVEGDAASLLVRETVRTVAQQAAFTDGARCELIVMAPTVDRVTLDARTHRGTIAQATERQLPFALMALDADLAARHEARVAPIQSLSVRELLIRCPMAGLSTSQWAMLRRLPIVVPVADDLTVSSASRPPSGE